MARNVDYSGDCECTPGDSFSQEEKREMYRAGEYVLAVPPVPTTLWDEDSWIGWIDHVHGWTRPAKGANP
jgi:hypothetical protein